MFRWLSPLVIVCLIVSLALPQSLLQRARIATIGKKNKFIPDTPPSPTPHDPNDPSRNSTSSAEGLGALFSLVFIGATSPFWVPHFLMDDDSKRQAYFPGHPYALKRNNYLDDSGFSGDNGDRSIYDATYLKPWAARVSLEDGNNFSGLNRLSGSVVLDTGSRFGVSTNWDHYFERKDGITDETVLGDLNVTYRFTQGHWLVMTTGLGIRGLFDRQMVRGGVNFQYGADIFPCEPVVVSSHIELGNLAQAFVLRLRTTVGWQIQHGEVFVGYDWLRIGGADLHGPMVGMRLWW